jgi:hypothetical protein
MKATELVQQLNNIISSKGDADIEVFTKGEIYSVKEVNFLERDGSIELACGWDTIEDERESEYITDIHKKGW